MTEILRVYAVDLSAPFATLPRNAGFVEPKAVLAYGYTSGYCASAPKSTHVYTYQPLVSPGWTPTDPIHYFFNDSSRVSSWESSWKGRCPLLEVDTPRSTDSNKFNPQDLKMFNGKVVTPLPVIVRHYHQATGLKIASDYVVIERAHIRNHEVSIWNRYGELLAAGVVVSVLPLVLLMALFFSGISKAWSWSGRMLRSIFGPAQS